MIFIDAEGQAYEQDLAEHLRKWHGDFAFPLKDAAILYGDTAMACLHQMFHDHMDHDRSVVTRHEHGQDQDGTITTEWETIGASEQPEKAATERGQDQESTANN